MPRGNNETAVAAGHKRTVGSVVMALLIAHGAALGLKAWDDRQTETNTDLATLQRTSLAGKEYIDGKAEKIIAAIENSSPGDASFSTLANKYPEIDLITTFDKAREAKSDSRMRVAAERIMIDGQDKGPLYTTNAGDILIFIQPDDRQALIAIGSADAWLPVAKGDYRYVLTGPGTPGTGNRQLEALSDNLAFSPPKVIASKGLPRVSLACTHLGQSKSAFCAMKPSPLFTANDFMRGVIYLLLLLAPTLAIFGLFKRLSGQTQKIEQALKTERDATHLINLTMEGAQAGFWEAYSDSHIIKISDQLAHLIGRPEGGELALTDFVDFVLEADRQNVQTAFHRATETRVMNVSFRPLKDAGRIWIELSGREVKDHNQKHIHFAGIAADVTDRKALDERLKIAERRLRNAIEGFDGPFAIWDSRKRLLYWNGAYARTFNLDKDLREGMSYDTVKLAATGSIRQETPSETEPNTTLLHLTTGQWIRFVERVTPEGGRISIGIDVTETTLSSHQLSRQKQKLKRLVAELERSEGHAAELARRHALEKERAERAANSKSAFLANMSHELRTPLNAINGFSEILANELYGPLGDSRYKGYASDILMSGQHLLDMINDILDMAKIEAGKMSIQRQFIDPVDPVDAAIRMIRRKAEDEGIQLILDAEDTLPEIEADHRAIRQMILNLVSNAIKFTDKGGRIAVTIRRRENIMRFAVTDTGIGIPEEDIPRLARPFEQVSDNSNRNYEGTGLGLALTKSFAEMHGGKMTIASQLGRGTTVAFYLPISARQVDYRIPAE